MNANADVLIVMGSLSDHPTMKRAEELLNEFGISFKTKIVSAHRTPALMYEEGTKAHENYKVIIAGAGGAAHLPGMMASLTILPVIGVPVAIGAMSGKDSLYSIVQMPEGVPVATVAIGNAGNAAILAAQILGVGNSEIRQKLVKYKESLSKKVEEQGKKI
ncbi:MAG: 5-(carboxyamino)imidazole ribonucleotide mutase [Bdellovibrionaceae bacterium]|nr:5-(carboxyamino)imidazole ribonucleotide mutase [Pseudobdellovibrionaceae bacterium]